MNEEPRDLPVLQESMDYFGAERDQITIPVLSEAINQSELESAVFKGLELSPTLHDQLSERITHLLEQKISDALPVIMQEVEQRISSALQEQIASQLPSIISDALKSSHN